MSIGRLPEPQPGSRLEAFHERNAAQAPAMLRQLLDTVIADGNAFEALMDAVRVCSLGRITNALFEVGGQNRCTMQATRCGARDAGRIRAGSADRCGFPSAFRCRDGAARLEPSIFLAHRSPRRALMRKTLVSSFHDPSSFTKPR